MTKLTISKQLENYRNNTEDGQLAIIDALNSRAITYKSLYEDVQGFSKFLLTQSIAKGDHVALISSASYEYIVAYLGITNIGAVSVNINPAYTCRELHHILSKCHIRLLLADSKVYKYLKEHDYVLNKIHSDKRCSKILDISNSDSFNKLLQIGKTITDNELQKIRDSVSPTDEATIKFTSGTTGFSKAVVHIHESILKCVDAFSKGYNYTKEDKVVLALPMFHVMGCELTMLSVLKSGATLVVTGDFKTGRVLETIEKYHCTAFHGVPTMFKFMANKASQYDISSLRLGMMGGAPMSFVDRRNIMKVLGLNDIILSYGQTEVLEAVQYPVSGLIQNNAETAIGKPLEGVRVLIKDKDGQDVPPYTKGEIVIDTPYRFIGYLNDQESTARTIRDNLVYTGDLGYLDEKGYLYFAGRSKDIIIRGGENISPLEIEEVIKEVPEVHDVAVVGKPDELLGEAVVACVLPSEGCTVTSESIISYCTKELARHKVPVEVFIMNELPMTPSGKIQKYILKEMIKEGEL